MCAGRAWRQGTEARSRVLLEATGACVHIAQERRRGWVGMAMASQEWEVEATWNVAQSHHLLSNHVSVSQDALLSTLPDAPERICLLPGPEKQPCELTGSTVWSTFRNNRSMLC